MAAVANAAGEARTGAPARVPSRPGAVTWLVVAAAAVAQLLRMLPTAGHTLWAEDGGRFYGENLALPLHESVFRPYNGYMHLVPRVTVWPEKYLPLTAAPWVAPLTAMVVVGLIAAYVLYASATVIRSVWVRAVLTLLVPLLPLGHDEVFGNLANLHWFLLYAACWAMLAPARSRAGTALACVVVAVSMLSDPVTGFLLPVLLVRGALTGWRGVRWPAVALALSGLVQLVAVVRGHDDRPVSDAASPAEAAGQYLVGVLGRSLFGGLAVQSVDTLGLVAALLAGLLVVALAVLTWRLTGDTRRIALAAGLAVAGAVLFLAYFGLTSLAPQRYAVAPALLLYAGVAVLVDTMLADGERTGRLVAAGTGVLIAVVVALNLPIHTVADRAPAWDDALAASAQECAPGTYSVRVPVAPLPNWFVTVPCERLRDAGFAPGGADGSGR